MCNDGVLALAGVPSWAPRNAVYLSKIPYCNYNDVTQTQSKFIAVELLTKYVLIGKTKKKINVIIRAYVHTY